MAKGQTTVSDFAVAPRRNRGSEQSPMQEDVATKPDVTPTRTQAPVIQPPEPGSFGDQAHQHANRVIAPTEEARRERATTRALQREESRVRLRDLKRARDRESKHYVNCPLDYDTKKRLEKAALENDVKMTVIMKAAIDQYLQLLICISRSFLPGVAVTWPSPRPTFRRDEPFRKAFCLRRAKLDLCRKGYEPAMSVKAEFIRFIEIWTCKHPSSACGLLAG